jgi:hypothetical protein
VTGLPHETIRGKRVLVVLGSGAAGAAAIDFASKRAADEQVVLTVVGIAPQVRTGRCAGCSPSAYNQAVIDAVEQALDGARMRMGDIGYRVTCELLVEGRDPPLADWSAAGRFDTVIVPARRRPLRSLDHPAAGALIAAGVEVVVIDRHGDVVARS